MLTRDKIIDRAYQECMTEMYAKAQPSADYNAIVAGVKAGTITDTDKNPVYARYFLSAEEFNYILRKYIKAYRLNNTWHSNVDVVRRYFDGKGAKDVWVDGKTDSDGYKNPGYRSTESVPHIKESFKRLLNNEIEGSVTVDKLATILSQEVFDYIYNCDNFYRFDREESNFSASVALGASPTSNPDTVIKYWKEHGVDVDIQWRNPLLLWEMDEYGDEFEEYMMEEYGKDWEKYWKDEWEKRKDLKNYGYDE